VPSKTNPRTRPGAARLGPTGDRATRRRAARRPTRPSLGKLGPWLAVGLVLVVLAGFVIAKLASSPPAPAGAATLAPAGVVRAVAGVPASVLDGVGTGSISNPPKRLPGGTPPLTGAGKPLIVYVGADYCPFCAAQRWALVQALSRFGTFSDLGATESGARDVFPLTQTFSFHGSSYRSSYVVFTAAETETNEIDPAGGYTKLETLTPLENRIMSAYDRPPYAPNPGAIPFVDIAGRFVVSGGSYDPAVLQGLTLEAIAAQLSDPSSRVAQGVDGSANVIVAAICEATGGKPGAVCSSPGVTKAKAGLGS
jgi:hypothetical protein